MLLKQKKQNHTDNRWSYHNLPNKRARWGGRNRTLNLVWSQWKWLREPTNTSTLSAENLIEIASVVSEIWPGKVKVRGAFIQAGAFIRQNMVYPMRFIVDGDFVHRKFNEFTLHMYWNMPSPSCILSNTHAVFHWNHGCTSQLKDFPSHCILYILTYKMKLWDQLMTLNYAGHFICETQI